MPVPGYPGETVKYETLRVMEAEGEKEYPLVVGEKLIKLNVAELLGGVEVLPPQARDLRREAFSEHREVVQVLFSYAHKDEELRDRLETHLTILQRLGTIQTWHDRKLMPGDTWAGIIGDNFQRAELILLLVSADFIQSEYCYEIEMKRALERHEKGEAKVVPIIVRECRWQTAPFGNLQVLPKDGKPVTSWRNCDEAWTNVEAGIEKVAEELRKRKR